MTRLDCAIVNNFTQVHKLSQCKPPYPAFPHLANSPHTLITQSIMYMRFMLIDVNSVHMYFCRHLFNMQLHLPIRHPPAGI